MRSMAAWTFATGDGHIRVEGAKGDIRLRACRRGAGPSMLPRQCEDEYPLRAFHANVAVSGANVQAAIDRHGLYRAIACVDV